MAGSRLGQEHRGLQIDPVDLVIRFLRNVQKSFLALNSNAVDQGIDPPLALAARATACRMEATDSTSTWMPSASSP